MRSEFDALINRLPLPEYGKFFDALKDLKFADVEDNEYLVAKAEVSRLYLPEKSVAIAIAEFMADNFGYRLDVPSQLPAIHDIDSPFASTDNQVPRAPYYVVAKLFQDGMAQSGQVVLCKDYAQAVVVQRTMKLNGYSANIKSKKPGLSELSPMEYQVHPASHYQNARYRVRHALAHGNKIVLINTSALRVNTRQLEVVAILTNAKENIVSDINDLFSIAIDGGSEKSGMFLFDAHSIQSSLYAAWHRIMPLFNTGFVTVRFPYE